MIDTKNKGNLIRLMIEMGRGPVHLPGRNNVLVISYLFRNSIFRSG
jgi:hypothetical protein